MKTVNNLLNNPCFLMSCCCISSSIFIFAIAGIGFVQYYHFGLVKGQFSGMNYETVYDAGRHFIWPFHEFVLLEKTIQFMDLDLEVYTRDEGSGSDTGIAGTPLDMHVGIQYVLLKDNVVPLFQKYNLLYNGVLQNLAIETIKNNATLFVADEYLTARRTIEAQFEAVVKAELLQVGLVEVEAVQLKRVTFPQVFYNRKLEAGIQEQRNLIEEFDQNSTVIRSQTGNQVKFIANDAAQRFAAAQAQGSLIRKQGINNATRISGEAQALGLQILSDELSITNQTQLLSLDYLINLQDNKAVSAFVNFGEFASKQELSSPQ